MADLSILRSFTSTANSLSNLILVTPESEGYQPQPLSPNEEAIPRFLFHYEGDNIVELSSQITDHYVEDNTSIEDNIALSPEIITVNGFIGELNDIAPGELFEAARFVIDKLTLLGGYVPGLSATAQRAYNNVESAYNAATTLRDRAVSLWRSDGTPQNEQQKAFQFFYGYWLERRLFKVQTPWAVFDNMAIKDIKSLQEDRDNFRSIYQIDFKKMRFAQEPEFEQIKCQGRLCQQNAPEINQGTTAPTERVDFSERYNQYLSEVDVA